MKKLTYSLIAFAFAAGAAQAQDTAAPSTSPDSQSTMSQTMPDQSASPDSTMPDAQSQPATPPSAASPSTGTVASSDVTDAEVSSYAMAAAKVQEIAKNAAIPDDAKQQQMASAVTASGIEPQRFNDISRAVGADAELRTRVQTAMAAHTNPSEG